MEKNTKIIIGVSTLVVIGGIILLVVAKNKKKIKDCTDKGGLWDKSTKTCIDPTTQEVIVGDSVGDSTGGYSGGSTGGSTSSGRPSTGFTSKAQGDAFRQWVNTKYPLWATANFLDKSGAFDNSYIRKAYEKYGTEYKSETTSPHLLAAKYLGGTVKTTSNSAEVKFNGRKNQAVFYNNGRFSIHRVGAAGSISKGNYLNGGKILVVTAGSKAGKTFKDGSVWDNLMKTL